MKIKKNLIPVFPFFSFSISSTVIIILTVQITNKVRETGKYFIKKIPKKQDAKITR